MKRLEDFTYHHALILGLAKSGTAAAKLLLDSGISVRINDYKANPEDPVVQDLKEAGAEIILGGHPVSALDGIDVMIKNPGIPYDNSLVAEAEVRGLPIITEVELAGILHKGPMIGITGSNGKTTTTTLTHEILLKSGKQSSIAGNIGEVSCEVARRTNDQDTLVIELSSFQLMGIERFRPTVAVLLNIYEAHLDYHKTLENYRQAKAQIFKNQSEEDFLVFNIDDPTIAKFIGEANAQLVPFSTMQKLDKGAYADEEYIYYNGEPIIKRDEVVLVGEHNMENILAAVAAAKLNGATNEGIINVLTSFKGVPHRLEFVDNIEDRLFYNDSKATNILATSKALSSFKQPVILLAGGLDRGNDFDELVPFLDHVKAMVVFGETAGKMQQAGEQAGITAIKKVDNVEQAAQAAYELSENKDVILLSPACASWDQYRTFEERGNMYVQAVHKLK
ncbi:UDP-N-acetylmuramoylalanine--D-glutamate ligase [Thalassobacillus cyri]|uniref:UDP-N-acetylmuramoylalanine--D-glutamate ligase n=1 Tax=Thalassobacillus cyri TaxID=571932 RepID=A0A1H4H677_9BACI|nr:UDP-N-acetylmuramoyl-L-alanine--D-glutamate ligase [Thalassobacillus cyri]SEB17317.1 UDP-N-acetylmuramoylalanine--D-glutamate ligase [Thalassobacillus cyri]